ncbi:MAG: ComEA family DNA-binding protein [Terriglobia bacterium]
MAFRSRRTLIIRLESLAAILLFSLSVFPATAIAQQKESHKPTKAPTVSIDINRASKADFEKLPGIGPELAHRIVAYRTKHGPFHRVEDLLIIRGIGPKKWKALRPYLRVGDITKTKSAGK